MEPSPEVTGPSPGSPSTSVSWSFVKGYGKGVPNSPQSELTFMSADQSRAGSGRGGDSLEYSGDGGRGGRGGDKIDVAESREGRLRGLLSFLDKAEGSGVKRSASGRRDLGGIGLNDNAGAYAFGYDDDDGDDDDDDDGEDSWKQQTAATKSQTVRRAPASGEGSLVRESVAPGKKWLWDEWKEEVRITRRTRTRN